MRLKRSPRSVPSISGACHAPQSPVAVKSLRFSPVAFHAQGFIQAPFGMLLMHKTRLQLTWNEIDANSLALKGPVLILIRKIGGTGPNEGAEFPVSFCSSSTLACVTGGACCSGATYRGLGLGGVCWCGLRGAGGEVEGLG